MKLAKLLGAGKSFFGGKGSVSYREDKRVYLPKFGAAKNPFALKPAEPGGDEGGAPGKISAPVAVKVAAKTQKIYYAPTAPKPTRAIGWADKLNPFRAPQPAAEPMPNVVQSELSLDAVKVLHNDLSDADVEIVPVKSRTVAAEVAPANLLNERVLETA